MILKRIRRLGIGGYWRIRERRLGDRAVCVVVGHFVVVSFLFGRRREEGESETSKFRDDSV